MEGSRSTRDPDGPDRASPRIEASVARWVGVIRRAASRYRLFDADAEELTQDVRLRLWRLLEREGADAEISPAYVHRAAVSSAIDLVRRRRGEREQRTVPLELVEGGLGRSPDAVGEDDLVAALERALERVPESRRPAVRLHLAGRHLDEIAVVMGWTPAKARNLLYRGLDDLRRHLREGA